MPAIYLTSTPSSPTTRKRLITPSKESFLKEDLIHHPDSPSTNPSSSPISRLRPIFTSRRPIRTALWILTPLILWTLLILRPSSLNFFFPTHSRSTTTSPTSTPKLTLPPGLISLETIVNLTEQRLLHLQSTFRPAQVKHELNINIPHVSLPEYRDELYQVYLDYFDTPRSTPGSTSEDEDKDDHHEREHEGMWATIEERLSLFPKTNKLRGDKGRLSDKSKGIPLEGGIPKMVYSTSVKNDLPYFFYSWANMNLDWTVSWYDDPAINAWMKETFSASDLPNLERRKQRFSENLRLGLVDEDRRGWGDELMGFIEEFNALPRGVLRSDSFRYLKLLYQGGIYTDSDTSCVRPLLEWPGLQGNSPNAHILSDPLFTLAPYLLSLSPSPPPASDERDDDDTPDPSILSPEMLQEAISASLDDALGMPQLIVAVEFDAPYTKFNWVERGYARSIQFVQWTMGAQPYHPVYLDVMGRIMRYSEQIRINGTDLGSGEDFNRRILEWTGPGIFTDCVFRYLLNRYGIHPRQLSGINHPVRIGDVLIYPLGGFQSNNWSGFQGDYQLVYHQIMHRWHHGREGNQ